MKLIFVDIDGPLVTDHSELVSTKWGKIGRMNPKCIQVFNEILTESNADYIISSDWRHRFSLEQLGEIFEWHGVLKRPIDITPIGDSISMTSLEKNRRHQIKTMLEKYKPEQWVAFDDLELKSESCPCAVLCFSEEGLGEKDIKEQILNFLY